MRRLLCLSFACALLIALEAAAQATQYRIIDLGSLGRSSYAYAINDRGQVVGSSDLTGSTTNHAFLWQNGSMQDLGTLGEMSCARGINNSGQVVGYSSLTGTGAWHAFQWQNGAMKDLGTQGGWHSTANGINDSGQAAGRTSTYGSYNPVCVWDNGTVSVIGTLGGSWGEAYGISDNGDVVGESLPSLYPGVPYQAFLWHNGRMWNLYTGTDCYGSCAYGINNVCQVVGEFRDPYGTHPFLWQNGSRRELGTLGGSIGHAYGINDSGHAVGSSYVVGNKELHACLWQDGSIQDLGTLGGNQSVAYGINENGWICGYAADVNDVQHAVVWQPVPEPSSVVTVLCGIGGMGGVMWGKKLRMLR